MKHMYFSARTEGRISYGHLGRTSLLRNATNARNAVKRKRKRKRTQRNERKQQTPRTQRKNKERIAHSMHYLHCLLCFESTCVNYCQCMLVAFLLYKRLHHRCRRRRYRFWVKEIGRCNCLPCVIIPKIIFRRFCIHRHRVQSYRTGYPRTKLITCAP